MSNEIKKLAKLLENKINSKVAELVKFGELAKQTEILLKQQHRELYMRFRDLECVEYFVKYHNPKMYELYDALKIMFDEDKSCDQETLDSVGKSDTTD